MWQTSGSVRVSQSSCGSKRVILSKLGNRTSQSGCGLGQVSSYFFFNETTYICHLESHTENYLM